MAAWMQFFMNASNHDPPEAPKIASYHWATGHAGHDGKKKQAVVTPFSTVAGASCRSKLTDKCVSVKIFQ
jgi:hypothetical protein